MSVLNKYLKYKKKYLELKQKLDGGAQQSRLVRSKSLDFLLPKHPQMLARSKTIEVLISQPENVSSVLPKNVSIADVPGYGITKQEERIPGNPNSKTEDTVAVATKQINGDTIIFMCVADGHGGTYVYSEMACTSAVQFFIEHMTWENIETQLLELFIELDSVTTAYMETLPKHAFIPDLLKPGGTTFVCAVINKTQNDMVYANLGDSKCILVRNGRIEHESVDHDVDNQDELDRISAMMNPGIKIIKPYLVHKYGDKIMLTRSLGDWAFGNAVSKEPKIERLHLERGDAVVVTTDGLFEILQPVFDKGILVQYKYGPGRPVTEIAIDVTSGLQTRTTNIAKHLIDEHLRKLGLIVQEKYGTETLEPAYNHARDSTDNKAVAVYIHNP